VLDVVVEVLECSRRGLVSGVVCSSVQVLETTNAAYRKNQTRNVIMWIMKRMKIGFYHLNVSISP